jgi:transposase
MFGDYLDNLSTANKHGKIALLMDNASLHKTPAMMLKMEELEIKCIWSVPFQPDLNPTEACFSKIKNYYKRQKLNKVMNEEELDYK